MKFFKKIHISSNGSFYFCNEAETSVVGKFVFFTKIDDKNFKFYQKNSTSITDLKHSFYSKKRYLK